MTGVLTEADDVTIMDVGIVVLLVQVVVVVVIKGVADIKR